MSMIYKKFSLLSLISIFLLSGLSGCTRTIQIPRDGDTTKQVYDQHVSGGYSGIDNDSSDAKDVDQADVPDNVVDRLKDEAEAIERQNIRLFIDEYTRTEQNSLDNLFRTLPNPRLTTYVYPHLTENSMPVPGYTTVYSLYEKDEIAMPGEVRP